VLHQNGIVAVFLITNIGQQISADTNNPSEFSTFRTYLLPFRTYTNHSQLTGHSSTIIVCVAQVPWKKSVYTLKRTVDESNRQTKLHTYTNWTIWPLYTLISIITLDCIARATRLHVETRWLCPRGRGLPTLIGWVHPTVAKATWFSCRNRL